MKLRKAVAAVAVALAIGGMSTQARADAFGGAFINITDFTISGPGLSPETITIISATDTLLNTARLTPGGAEATFDGTQACVTLAGGAGDCVTGEDDFAIVDEPPPDATFARGDSAVSPGLPFGPGGGVDAATVAEVSIATPFVDGAATGSITLESSFLFTVGPEVGPLTISFDADTFLQAWTAAGTPPPTSASATNTWELTLAAAGGPNLVVWAPQDVAFGLNPATLQQPCDLNATMLAGPSNPQDAIECSGQFSGTTTFTLLPNVVYSFGIVHSSAVTARQFEGAQVPEPSSLLLLGLGLAGLGFARRYIKAV